jgi:hypothetical protein
MLRDRWVDHRGSHSAQSFERLSIIQPDQAAVADHVGVHHSDELSPI